MSAPEAVAIDFYFDPMCPYAYQGSLWIREVRALRPIDISWKFFSLEEINREEGKKHPWERPWSYGWSQMRIGAFLRRQGEAEVDRWYEAVGSAFFNDAIPTQQIERHREVLRAAGIDPSVVDEAIADPTTHDEVRADHERATREIGAFGVPIVEFPDGSALFGPVVVPAPTGDEAVRLWDYMQGFTSFPTLFELKRPKRREDLIEIATRFEPYLRARSWRTIENPAP